MTALSAIAAVRYRRVTGSPTGYVALPIDKHVSEANEACRKAELFLRHIEKITPVDEH